MSSLGGIEHRLQTSFGEVCWFEWNKAEEGPVLLLLHATGFHARVWDQVIAHLPQNLHVVAPDQLGHGRSAKPDSLVDWTITAAALLPLLDQFKGRPIIAGGHSMGGHVLSQLAALDPNAFQKILLIDPVIMAPDFYVGTDLTVLDPSDHPISRRRSAWDSPEQMLAHFGERPPYSKWDKAVLADYCRYGLLEADDGVGFKLACPPRLEASVYQSAHRKNPFNWLDKITADCILLRAPTSERAGEMDFSNSPTWLGLGEKMGVSQDLLWSDNSHFIPMEAPEKVADLLKDMIAH